MDKKIGNSFVLVPKPTLVTLPSSLTSSKNTMARYTNVYPAARTDRQTPAPEQARTSKKVPTPSRQCEAK